MRSFLRALPAYRSARADRDIAGYCTVTGNGHDPSAAEGNAHFSNAYQIGAQRVEAGVTVEREEPT